MSEVIILDDSDEDEALPPPVSAYASISSYSAKPRPKPKKVSLGSSSDVVDLLDDSDDEDEDELVIAPPLNSNSKLAARKNQNVKSTSTPTSPQLQRVSTNTTSNLALNPYAKKNGSADKKRATAARKASFLRVPADMDDDSDSDDSFLHFESGLTIKKKAAISPSETVVAAAVAGHSSSSIDTPTSAVRNPYAKTTPASSTPSTSTSDATGMASTSPRNPYAKKPSPTSSTSEAAAAVAASTTGTPQNPYVKRIPSTASTGVRLASSPGVYYPQLGATSKTYEDIRAKYVLAFWKHSKKLIQHSHDRQKLDQVAKKIVILALSEYPIRSLDEFTQRSSNSSSSSTGNNRDNRDAIRTMLESGDVDRIATPVDSCRDGRYYSIAEACLVAMLSETERFAAVQSGSSSNANSTTTLKATMGDDDESLKAVLENKDHWVSLASLIPQIDQRLKDECPGRLTRHGDADGGAAHYTKPSTRSAEYRQIEKLLVCPKDSQIAYLKQHQRQGQVLFELTTLGYRSALRIRKRVFPAPPGHLRCSNLSRVEERYRGMCLGIDLREGGGGTKKLHSM
jgi:hypothetical protein